MNFLYFLSVNFRDIIKIKLYKNQDHVAFILGLPRWLNAKDSASVQETQVRSLGWEDPTPEFLPGKSQGQRNLVDHSPGRHKELDTMEHMCNFDFIFWTFSDQ